MQVIVHDDRFKMGIGGNLFGIADFFAKWWWIGGILAFLLIAVLAGYTIWVSFNTYLIKTGFFTNQTLSGLNISFPSNANVTCLRTCVARC